MSDELWKIEAIIQPYRLDAVTQALEQQAGFGGMTVSDCRGFGHEKLLALDAASEADAPASSVARHVRDTGLTDFTAKLKVECVVAGQAAADELVRTIARAAHTGRRGDGKIFAWPIARVVRVRTLEEGKNAL